MYNNVYNGKTVLITGHTGFKGAWLSAYLLRLGATVIGYSLEPPTERNLFLRADLENRIHHHHGDIRNMATFAALLAETRPNFIFHMAAQPIVLEAYRNPMETFEVNVMGTVAVMEAVRQTNLNATLILIATDKVYENNEWVYGYRETDPLGGYDPYSASKGAMEIAVSSYLRSYFNTEKSTVRAASVRSGNVIGGGDWADNRLVPDCIHALSHGKPIPVRNPQATRPWQHVLEPLSGYLWLGAILDSDKSLSGAWNFGPTSAANSTVETLVNLLIQGWGSGDWQDQSDPDAPHEAHLLKLNIDKAQALLGWTPVWDFRDTIHHTVQWYKSDLTTDDPDMVFALMTRNIDAYEASARALGLPYVPSPH
jgi:CDP-glucose 4,6-dehydratase